VLLTVPPRLLLDTGVALASPIGPLVQNFSTGWDPDHDPLALMVFLVYALHQPTSFWGPLIRLLPLRSNMLHPVFFSELDIRELQSSPAKAAIKDHWATVKFLHIWLQSFAKVHPVLLPRVNKEVVQWLFVVLLSRTLHRSLGSLEHVTLPTGVDMLNHEPSALHRARFSIAYSRRHQSVMAMAGSSFVPGQQFFVTYGKMTLAECFATYGIINKEAPRVSFFINFDTSPSLDSTTQEIASTVLLRYGCLSNGTKEYFMTPEGPDPAFLCCARLTVMSRCEVHEVQHRDTRQCLLSPQNEGRSIRNVKDAFREVLATYASTLEEDRVILNSKTLTREVRAVIELRYYEKLTWKQASASLDDHMRKLNSYSDTSFLIPPQVCR